MRRCVLAIVMLVALLAPAGGAWAQNTPFSSPALDSNCYFPQIGDPNQIDTICGTRLEYLGGGVVKNLGVRNGQPGNILIENLDASESNVADHAFQISTGASFNLHNLNSHPQNLYFSTSGPPFVDPSDVRFGHFHNSTAVDLLDVGTLRIYWSNASGDYDSARYTSLSVNIRGNYGAGYEPWIITPYFAHLTSDTVDDLVLGFTVDWNHNSADTVFIALYRGGAALASKIIAFEDTSAIVMALTDTTSNYDRVTTQGDFRGTGRDDLIIMDAYSNMWYYANSRPFNIGDLARAITEDTLLVGWQNPKWIQQSQQIYPGSAFSKGFLAMPALPKAPGDKSLDFVFFLPVIDTVLKGDTDNHIFMFRGGPDFGSHRLTLDSAAFVIPHPKELDNGRFGFDYDWPEGIEDAGNLTGCANHVLHVGAGASGGYGFDNFYVTGTALDQKIDMFVAGGGEFRDSITADNDKFEDAVGVWAYYGNDNLLNSGTMWIYHGSKDIPVHLNPKFAGVKNIVQKDGAGITFAPNPVTATWSVVTIVWPEAEDGQYNIYDMLGRQMQHGAIHLYGGAEQQRMYFSGMPQGVYIYTIEGAHGSASAQFVKTSGASSSSGISQPSIIQQMKDVRDGRTNPAGLSSPASEISR